MSETPEAEIMKAKAWYEQDLRPRMKTGEGKSIPELLAEYGRHIAAEKDAEIERLREELDIWKSVFPDIAPERVLPDGRHRMEVGPLDEDDYEEIVTAAAIKMKKFASGVRGQVMTVRDSFGWWVMKETERRIAAEKDKEIERLRAENDRLQKMVEPKWFYPGPEYDSEGCYFSEGDVVQVVLDWDGRPGEVRVIEIARATPLPTVWACAKVLTDEEKLAREDDGDFVFTLHDSEEEAEAQKAVLEGEKADG